MLVQIGKRRDSAADLVDLLYECHGRIRRFLRMAGQLCEVDSPSREEVTEIAAQIRRYFAEAFPLHVADEDLDIAPRLPLYAGVAKRVHDEHQAHAPLVADLIAICDRLRRDPEDHPALRERLEEVTRRLAEEMETHMELEERTLFPALRELDATTQSAILAAMRQRRRVAS